MTRTWRPDLLSGFQATDIALAPHRAPGEDVDPVATLVRRVRRSDAGPQRRAVLYLHGWNDYFFQRHLATYWASRNYRFYALDLRRYGRSLRPGQLFGFVGDLSDYEEELAAAMDIVAAEHDEIVLMGHSTGGLIAALFADGSAAAGGEDDSGRWIVRNPGRLTGLVLNSPWLDLQGAPIMRTLGGPMLAAMGDRAATAVIRLPDNGWYARAVQRAQGGEWDFDLALKSSPSPPVRVGWLRAILRGHRQVAHGLAIAAPIVVLCSDKTLFRRRWSEDLRSVDTVLDVEQIATRAPRLGPCVTVTRIPGALHDVFLSAPPVRAAAFAEIDRWSRGYLL